MRLFFGERRQEKGYTLFSVVCCNLTQTGEKFRIATRKVTEKLFEKGDVFLSREIILYLKKCKNCGGSRITVFAETVNGQIYFIERIKSKNVKDFISKNPPLRKIKKLRLSESGGKGIPLKYFDGGRELPCRVNFSSLRLAPYETDLVLDLKRLKENQAMDALDINLYRA